MANLSASLALAQLEPAAVPPAVVRLDRGRRYEREGLRGEQPAPIVSRARRNAARSSIVAAGEPSPVPVSSQVAGTHGSPRRAGRSS